MLTSCATILLKSKTRLLPPSIASVQARSIYLHSSIQSSDETIKMRKESSIHGTAPTENSIIQETKKKSPVITSLHKKPLSSKGQGSLIIPNRSSSSSVSASLEIEKTPLDVPLKNLQATKYYVPERLLKSPFQTTTLSNGMRISSMYQKGHLTSVGAFYNLGSRYEQEGQYGSSHFLDRLTFRSTSKRSQKDIMEVFDSLGSLPFVSTGRESVTIQTISFASEFPRLVDLVGDTLCNAEISEAEIDEIREMIQWEMSELSMKPDTYLAEILHEVAYNGKGLGNWLFCYPELVEKTTRAQLKTYRDSFLVAPNLTVGVIGAHEHDEVVDMVSKAFVGLPEAKSADKRFGIPGVKAQSPAEWNKQHAGQVIKPVMPNELSAAYPSKYVGGHHMQYVPGIPLIHLALVFETVGCLSQDLPLSAVLHILMGGGGSFSSGGPGKGILSRLYVDVLSEHHWVDHASSYAVNYFDSGLQGFYFAVAPSNADNAIEIMVKEAQRMTMGFSEEEVQRAKAQVKSLLLMNLEGRMVVLDDAMRQISLLGKRQDVEKTLADVDKITPNDLLIFAKRLISTAPTLVAVGETQYVSDDSIHLVTESFPLRSKN